MSSTLKIKSVLVIPLINQIKANKIFTSNYTTTCRQRFSFAHSPWLERRYHGRTPAQRATELAHPDCRPSPDRTASTAYCYRCCCSLRRCCHCWCCCCWRNSCERMIWKASSITRWTAFCGTNACCGWDDGAAIGWGGWRHSVSTRGHSSMWWGVGWGVRGWVGDCGKDNWKMRKRRWFRNSGWCAQFEWWVFV